VLSALIGELIVLQELREIEGNDPECSFKTHDDATALWLEPG